MIRQSGTFRCFEFMKKDFDRMKFVIQRVQHASVTVDNEVIGKIGKGFLVLIGVSEEDNTENCRQNDKKLIGMRIFEDEMEKPILALKDDRWRTAVDFSVYLICRLQKRKSSIFY